MERSFAVSTSLEEQHTAVDPCSYSEVASKLAFGLAIECDIEAESKFGAGSCHEPSTGALARIGSSPLSSIPFTGAFKF